MKTSTLDKIIYKNLIKKYDLIKLDTGSELNILKGI